MPAALPTPLLAPYGHIDSVSVQCAALSAHYYQVPELLLHAILQKEDGRVGQSVRNKNGTFDLGQAQINTVWLDEFKRYGVKAEHLRDDRCTNLYAAGYILRLNVNHYGGNDWFRAAMAYNIGPNNWEKNPKRYRTGYKYAYDVVKRWTALHQRVFGNPKEPASVTSFSPPQRVAKTADQVG